MAGVDFFFPSTGGVGSGAVGNSWTHISNDSVVSALQSVTILDVLKSMVDNR